VPKTSRITAVRVSAPANLRSVVISHQVIDQFAGTLRIFLQFINLGSLAVRHAHPFSVVVPAARGDSLTAGRCRNTRLGAYTEEVPLLGSPKED
jgi:hypothetical protein